MSEEIVIGTSGEDNGLDAGLAAIEARLSSLDTTLGALNGTLGSVGDALDGLADDTQEAGDEVEEAAPKVDRMSQAMEAASTTGIALAKGFGLVTAAAGAVLGAVALSTAAFGEQDAINTQLEDTYNRLGAAAGAYAETQRLVAEASARTGQGDEDLLVAVERYARLTQDATISREQLSTIQGIAARTERDLAGAAKRLADAQRGKVEGLEEILPLTKDEIDALNRVEDGNKRAAIAVDLLNQQYGGAAEQINPTALATRNLTNAQGDLVQRVGEVITASGLVPAVLNPITDSLREGEQALDDNSEAAQRLILTYAVDFVDAVIAVQDVLIDNVTTLNVLGAVVGSVDNVFFILTDTVELLTAGIVGLATGAVGGLIFGLGEAISLAGELATATGQDGLAADLEGMGARARAAGQELAEIGDRGFEVAGAAAVRATGRFDEAIDSIADASVHTDTLRSNLEKTREVTQGIRDNLGEARDNVQGIDTSRSQGARSGPSGAPLDKTKARGLSRQEKADRAETRRLDLEILAVREQLIAAQAAGLEQEQINLTYKLDGLEAAKSLVGVKDSEVKAAREQVALLERELKAQEAQQDLAQKRTDEAKRRAQEKEKENRENERARKKREEDAQREVELAAQREALMLRIAAAQTTDATQARLLEIEADRVVAQASIADETEREYELLKLTLAEEQALADARSAALEERLVATERLAATLSDVSAVGAILDEELTSALEAQAEDARSAEDIARAQAAAVRDQAAAYGELVDRLGQAAVAFQQAAASEDLLADGAEATAVAIGAAAGAASGIAGLFVEGARERAAVEAAINGAAAVAAFGAYAATGFTVQPFAVAAANHAAAAVQYGVIAGTTPQVPAGLGGSASAGGQATGPTGPAGGGGFDPALEREANARAIAEAIAEADRSRQGVQVYQDFRGALMPNDPQALRQLGDLVGRGW